MPQKRLASKHWTSSPFVSLGVAVMSLIVAIASAVFTFMQMDIARKQFYKTDRPNLAIEQASAQLMYNIQDANSPISPPDAKEPNIVSLNASVTVRNIGHSIASHTQVRSFLILRRPDDQPDTLYKQQEGLCKVFAAHKNTYSDSSADILPDEPFTMRNTSSLALVYPDATRDAQDGSFYVTPTMLVCGDYQMGDGHHQTSAIFYLYDGNSQRFKVGENIPAADIRLQRNQMADHAN